MCGETSAKLLPDSIAQSSFGAVSSAIPVAALFRGSSAMRIHWLVTESYGIAMAC